MSTINTKLSVGDFVYQKEFKDWDCRLNKYTGSEVVLYQVRSLAVSCNAKNEWKISYRLQRYIDGKTVDWGFNIKEEDVGKKVFLTREEAENCNELQ